MPPPPAAAQRQHGEGSREPHELAGAAPPDEKWPIIDLFDILNVLLQPHMLIDLQLLTSIIIGPRAACSRVR